MQVIKKKKKILTFYLDQKDADSLKKIQKENLRDRSGQITHWIRLTMKAGA